MKYLLELLAIYVFFCPLALLPLPLARKAGEFMGVIFYRAVSKRRHIAIDNLTAVANRGGIRLRDEAGEVARECFRNVGRSVAEIVKVYFGLGGRLIRGIRVEGIEHFQKARAEGRGVIFITGHCGNFELWGLSMPTKVGKAWGVAKKQKNPYLNAIIEMTRQRFGGMVVYKEGAMKRFISVLREGGSVGIVMDEPVKAEKGVQVEFLGAPRWVTKMAAALARRTSAAVLPVFMHWDGQGHVIKINPEVPVTEDEAADTRNMAAQIEAYIRENPSHWLLWLRRWKKKKKRSS